MKSITVDATLENLDKVIDFLNKELDAINCDETVKFKIDVAVDEIFSNIANYAYKPVDGKATVGFDEKSENKQVEIVFEDSGKPYNPLKKEYPNRDIGGLGILIVKKSMDEVLYEYKDKKNILTLRKKI